MLPHIEIFLTEDRGFGVRILEPVKKGSLVIEYWGYMETSSSASRTHTIRTPSGYLDAFLICYDPYSGEPNIPVCGHYLLMPLGCGGFMNSGKEDGISNVRISTQEVSPVSLDTHRATRSRPTMAIWGCPCYATRDLEAGEELFVEYAVR